MLLERMNAVIYGGGGTIGSAVAAAFAREGAAVHLAGRTATRWSGLPAGSASTVAPPPSPRSMRSTRRRSTPMPMPWSATTGRSTSR